MKNNSTQSNRIFTPLGASNHSQGQRQPQDFYATPPVAIDELLKGYPDLPQTIWEPCCGTGNLSKRLMEFGFTVYSTDLVDRGYGQSGIDFLQTTLLPPNCRCILTNFPYRLILPMTLHALDLLPAGGVLCSFAKTVLLEGQARYYDLFRDNPPRYVLQFVRRIECGKDGVFTGSSAVAYAWFVWEKGYTGDPVVKWINK